MHLEFTNLKLNITQDLVSSQDFTQFVVFTHFELKDKIHFSFSIFDLVAEYSRDKCNHYKSVVNVEFTSLLTPRAMDPLEKQSFGDLNIINFGEV